MSGMLYVQKCPGMKGEPCSEECTLTASKVVRALLWGSKRAKNSTAVFGGLLSACQDARHNSAAKTTAKKAAKTSSIAAHLGGLPQYGPLRIVDARAAGPSGDQYSTDASAAHDRIWMLKGIEQVLLDLNTAKFWAKARYWQCSSRHQKPLPQWAEAGSPAEVDLHTPVPATEAADLRSWA